ncbi:hypothetical protein Taro_006394 [Colocasia esculenta]|uniref:Chloroplast lumen common family protein n=1 Tax=Colocasia esculenta TaxID=4460 RepID=A0A843U0M5_COLES|nr:hypothetical protein [Colocasia esculenta]
MNCADTQLLLCPTATPHIPTITTRRYFLSRTRTLSVDPITSHHLLLFSRSNLRSHFPSLSISLLPPISCLRTPRAHVSGDGDRDRQPLLKSCARTLVVLLVGTLFFVGRLGRRPALSAVDSRRSNSRAPMVEKVATHDEVKQDAEDDELAAGMLETNPRDVEALKMALYAKMKKGKTREAVDYVERLIDVEPEEVEWRLLQALCYELMGRLSRAKQLFKDILKERPLLLRALHGLALVMHKNREGPAVFDMLNKALELARCEQRVTEERNIRILIAQMHVIKGDLEGGLVKFQKLAEENPKDFRPYLCQGIIYSLLDKKQEAEEQFEIYRNLVPDEFPQRDFLDDVILEAKVESQEQLKKQLQSEFSGRG